MVQGEFASAVYAEVSLWDSDGAAVRNEEEGVKGTVYVDVSCGVCSREGGVWVFFVGRVRWGWGTAMGWWEGGEGGRGGAREEVGD